MEKAIKQVNELLRRLEWCESLYPSSRAFRTEKPNYMTEEMLEKIGALQAWQTVTRRLRIAILTLQRWTGSKSLDGTQAVSESIETPVDHAVNAGNLDPGHNSTHILHLLDTSSFVERLQKDETLQIAFEKRALGVIFRLCLDSRNTYIENATLFNELNLPKYTSDLLAVVEFPPSIVKDSLVLRNAYASKIEGPNAQNVSEVLIGQLTDGIRRALVGGTKMKRLFRSVEAPDPKSGFYLPVSETMRQEFDKALIASLKFFFRLLHFRLDRGDKTVITKETQIMDDEWKFLVVAVRQIEGGDALLGEHYA